LFACRAKMPSVLCASHRKDGIVLDNRILTAISACQSVPARSLSENRGRSEGKPF
jgi:hypothetical protein